MKREAVPVVDLFAGAGGLTEGFAALKGFEVAMSIEMEPTAYRTLRLRSFLHKFPAGFPPEYYAFLNGDVAREPDWLSLYPHEWREACDNTRCLKLGTSDADTFIRARVAKLRAAHGGRTVLVGGPPCQSYSVKRRRSNSNLDMDARQTLYMEFVKVLAQLQPAVAVMENVRGILSARHLGRPVIGDVMKALTNAGGKARYRLVSLAPPVKGRALDTSLNPKEFLVRSEDHGVPQARHRVFLVCVRSDLAASLPPLDMSEHRVSVHDAIGGMPKLRSRLGKNDSNDTWRQALNRARKLAECDVQPDIAKAFLLALDAAFKATQGNLPYRDASGGTGFPDTCHADLRDWLFDPNLKRLPNNEARSIMAADMGRYLYATAFAIATGKSPLTLDFPRSLASRHKSWATGKFTDRFRVQLGGQPATTIISHLSHEGHSAIHPDPGQCRSLTVREAARLQTFPDNYFFQGSRTQQYAQVGNAVPPYLARQIAKRIWDFIQQRKDGQ